MFIASKMNRKSTRILKRKEKYREANEQQEVKEEVNYLNLKSRKKEENENC